MRRKRTRTIYWEDHEATNAARFCCALKIKNGTEPNQAGDETVGEIESLTQLTCSRLYTIQAVTKAFFKDPHPEKFPLDDHGKIRWVTEKEHFTILLVERARGLANRLDKEPKVFLLERVEKYLLGKLPILNTVLVHPELPMVTDKLHYQPSFVKNGKNNRTVRVTTIEGSVDVVKELLDRLRHDPI